MSSIHNKDENPLPLAQSAEVHLDEWVTPDVTDEHGLLRAGKILEWMDVAGVLAAARHSRRPVVTASIDGIEFSEPIELGAHVIMTARVSYTSERSIGVSVSMAHSAPADRVPRPCLDAYMTFVALDDGGRPTNVAQIVAETPAQQSRFAEGQLRREFRRKLLETPIPLAIEAQDPLSGIAERERPLLVQELLKMLPRTLQLPWERRDTPRSRHGSYVHKVEPVRAGKLNFHNTLYGGTLMRWLEGAATLSARKHTNSAALRLVGLHGLNFLRPVERDRFVHIRAMVVHTARDTLTTLVSVQSEDPVSSQSEETLRGFLTYRPVDSNARIAPVDCLTEEDRALFLEVEQRLALQRSLAERQASAA